MSEPTLSIGVQIRKDGYNEICLVTLYLDIEEGDPLCCGETRNIFNLLYHISRIVSQTVYGGLRRSKDRENYTSLTGLVFYSKTL